VRADVWDTPAVHDNTATATRNELVHGSDQLHDLAMQASTLDEDWYRISQKPYASYEVVVDATSGRIGGWLLVERIDSLGAVTQTALPTGSGPSQSLRWMAAGGSVVDNERIRIRVPSSACNPTCGAEDVYRVRMYETSYAVPRFNNQATQVTILLLLNPSSYPITGNVHFWSNTGSFLGSSAFSLTPKQLLNLNTSTVSGAAGASGSITIAADGRYGDLAGKTVAIESATGFVFDTNVSARPR
jgi:hypothetical protein